MKRVEGKVALVTGAASGIGRASALMLADQGAKVALTDINSDGVREVATQIGASAIGIAHDVTSEDAWIDALDQTVAQFGKLHILVNCAGTAIAGSVEETSLEDWRALHALDNDSVFLGCKHGIRHIAGSGG